MWEAVQWAAVGICVLSALTTAALVLYASLNGAAKALQIAREALEIAETTRDQWQREKVELGGFRDAIAEEHERATAARNRAAALQSKRGKAEASEMDPRQQLVARALAGDRDAAAQLARAQGLIR